MSNKLQEIYDSILTCEKVIKDTDSILSSISQLESSKDEELKRMQTKISTTINSFSELKYTFETSRKSLEKAFVDYLSDCGLKCNIEDDHLIINEAELTQLAKQYLEDLKKYINIFCSKGFKNENEFLVISKNFKLISALLKTVFNNKDIKDVIVNKEIALLSKVSFEFLKEKEPLFDCLYYYYEEFLNKLNEISQVAFNATVIDYIINHTSSIALVYANNNYPKIEGENSLKRLFLCQFHSERNPSMRVSIEKNYINCFGCGYCGNQIDYLMEKEKITYNQAIYLLAEIYLFDIPNNPYKNQNTDIVKKYRDVLISAEFEQFLLQSYKNVSANITEDVSEVYIELLETIERIKKGESDPNFVFVEKTKKYENRSELKLKNEFKYLWTTNILSTTSN